MAISIFRHLVKCSGFHLLDYVLVVAIKEKKKEIHNNDGFQAGVKMFACLCNRCLLHKVSWSFWTHRHRVHTPSCQGVMLSSS